MNRTTTTPPPAPAAIAPADAARLLNCSRASIRNMITRGELRAFRVGTAVRIPTSEIDRILNGGPA